MSDEHTERIEINTEMFGGTWPDRVEFEIVETGDTAAYEFAGEVDDD